MAKEASFFPEEPPKEEPFYIGEHYLYDGFWYYYKFPVAWAKDHRDHSGPKQCPNCAEYGTLHNGSVFIGYCVNCAQRVYENSRGPGFFDHCKYEGVAGFLQDVDLANIPPLLCDVSPSETDDGDTAGHHYEPSILEPHFEGGYNDY